jgi:hypothetical protein
MAKQLNADLDLLLDEEGFSDFQEEMVRLFQSAFTALSENPSATLGSEADRAASGLRALIPPEKIAELAKEPEGELQINELFQDMWRGLIGVATRIPHQDDQGHTLIIKTLQALRADSEPLWKDLYELSPMMRDKWIGEYCRAAGNSPVNGTVLLTWKKILPSNGTPKKTTATS